LGETQDTFAERLGTAKSSLVRYESNRPPHGAVLARLAAIAEEHGQQECVLIFRRALAAEVGDQVQPKIDFRSDEEREYVLALLAVFRNSDEYAEELKGVKQALKRPKGRNQKELEEWRAAEGVKRAMFKLLEEGRPIQAVADLLGVPTETVDKAANLQKFFQSASDVGLLKK
jgi:transcriptional regulator with XRE-family HTH domain